MGIVFALTEVWRRLLDSDRNSVSYSSQDEMIYVWDSEEIGSKDSNDTGVCLLVHILSVKRFKEFLTINLQRNDLLV